MVRTTRMKEGMSPPIPPMKCPGALMAIVPGTARMQMPSQGSCKSHPRAGLLGMASPGALAYFAYIISTYRV